MLQPADALKIECKFVERMKAFLTRRKSLVDQCYCSVIPYFADAALVSLLEDCLEHSDECTLQKKADLLTSPTTCTTITDCESQVTVDTSSASTNCTYTAITYNSLNGGSFPSMIITDDSEYVNGSIDVRVTNSCNGSVTEETVLGGCTSGGCSSSHQARVGRGLTTTATHLNNLSYITKLRVYEADPFGSIVSGAIDLDLNPATSPYYADSGSCPGCTAVNSNDVKLGSSNFVTALTTLMNNVSLARYSETGRHRIFINHNTSTLITTIGSYYLHNPSEYIFGINKSNAGIWIYNPTTSKTVLFNSVNYNTFLPLRFYKDDLSFTTDCGTLEPIIGNQTIFTPVLTANANFNKIEFISPFSSYPVNITSDSSSSCTQYTLTGTYSPTNLVSSVEWLDSGDVSLSSTSSVIVTDPDTYTFEVTSTNGCVVSDSITIT